MKTSGANLEPVDSGGIGLLSPRSKVGARAGAAWASESKAAQTVTVTDRPGPGQVGSVWHCGTSESGSCRAASQHGSGPGPVNRDPGSGPFPNLTRKPDENAALSAR